MSEKKYDLLLVDDDTIRMDPIVAFLEETNFNVFPANSPTEAWEFLESEENNFKIIVLDLIIPTRGAYSKKQCPSAEKCGETFLLDLRDKEFKNEAISDEEHKKRIRIKEKYKNIPVVIFSARNIEQIIPREKLSLRKKLLAPPYSAQKVDSKKVFDFEEYSKELYNIAQEYDDGKYNS